MARASALRRTGRAATILVAALATLLVATPAGADPASEKQAEAEAVLAQIEALDMEVGKAVEEYNGARVMLERIHEQPTVRDAYATGLVEDGVLTADDVDAIVEEVVGTLRAAHDRLRASIAEPPAPPPEPPQTVGTGDAVETAVAADRLRALNEALLSVPDGFAVNLKLAKQLERRRETVESGGIDWGQGEALAFASLLEDGIPIRLSGQDTERGTFSHRHLVLHDPETGETATPMQHLPGASASFEVYNSPLSEYAALGFEYGYSVARPDALVLWEAQFGDFVNGAQTVIDEFISSAETKWRQQSGVVLLLPHGYEGQGPDHSSARIERFLTMAADDAFTVAQPSSAASHFHVLRRHSLGEEHRPLIIFTPKSMLRRKEAMSMPSDFTEGTFRPVIGDDQVDPDKVERALLCSGRITWDLLAERKKIKDERTAIIRVEQLYPRPLEELKAELGRFGNLQEVRWVQDEPANMGPWPHMALHLSSELGTPFYRVSRPESSSPSVGQQSRHVDEQKALLKQAFS